MKRIKYTLFSILSLLLAFQALAQPDTRRMNISIGVFTPSATSYDYEGAIGVVGSTGYTVDDIQPGDMFWDDRSRYQVDSVDIIVAGSSAMVWVTDLYSSGAPQSGKGTLGKPSSKTGIQPLTENGSNFITEAQEAKILTDNLQRLDSLGGDGNGVISALPSGDVSVDAAGNKLVLSNLDSFVLDTSFVIQPQRFGSQVLMDFNEQEAWLRMNPNGINGEFGIRMFANPSFRTIWIGDIGNDFNQAGFGVADHSTSAWMNGGYSSGIRAMGDVTTVGDYLKDGDETYIELDAGGDMTISSYNDIFFRGDGWSYEWPYGDPTANQVLGEGAVDDDILEWVDLPAADGNGIIEALPTAPVTIGANGNALIIDSTGTTKITAIGSAQADFVVSGNSSLPSALTQIVGVDTAQVFVQATGGIDLNSTQSIDFDVNGAATSWANTAPTAGQVMGDSDGDGQLEFVNDASLYSVDGSLATNRQIDLDGKTLHATWGAPQNLTSNPVDTANNGLWLERLQSLIGYSSGANWAFFAANQTEAKMVHKSLDNGNSNAIIKVGPNQAAMRVNNETTGSTLTQLTLSNTGHSLNFGAFSVYSSSTGDSLLHLYENKYAFPNEEPGAADSLKRVIVWEQGEPTFEVHNGSNYRVLPSGGNILPGDDYVEIGPGQTAYLPVPDSKYIGKRYRIIASASVGGPGSVVTVRCVDGSSNVGYNSSSINLSTPLTNQGFVCNGSTWVILY